MNSNRTIADLYFADTGETVGKACKSMHAGGISIERASQIIGYKTSSDLRKYLARRGIECPWPKKRAGSPGGHPPIRITDNMMERYVDLRRAGVLADIAAREAGHSRDSIRQAIRARRPDLKLPRRKAA
ncbi:MAG: hypothetical protein KKC55_17810 [Gammaproteobacteria bacterium]|uniref:Uncharacterized protein n=1 Tax=viral metagenome TaxID=1070528 RepID=A0A6M3M6H1_9ZZZZ|nr:hypothetical protein [Gammaproteobacteria bacterium]